MLLNSNIETKTFFGTVTAVFAYLADTFNELMVILGLLILTDYLLGVTVAIVSGTFDVKVGITGIFKKIAYLCLIVLGFLLDFTISYFSKCMSLDITTNGVFGYAITCYLIGNEGLSNIKSLALLGLPIPEFLKRGFGLIATSGESIAEMAEDTIEEKIDVTFTADDNLTLAEHAENSDTSKTDDIFCDDAF